MEDGEDFLGGEEAVGNEADEEGGDHSADGGGSGGEADLGAREVESLTEEGAEGDVPCAPDEVFEKHHEAEAGSYGEGHWEWSFR